MSNYAHQAAPTQFVADQGHVAFYPERVDEIAEQFPTWRNADRL